MRTIKFRGQRVDTKEWVYGNLITGIFFKKDNGEDIPYIITADGIDYDCFEDFTEGQGIFEVIPETVGQFTGLYDNNKSARFPKGRPIYEGDILPMGTWTKPQERTSGTIYEVVKMDNGIWTPIAYWKQEVLKVIGNIHDNPELFNA